MKPRITQITRIIIRGRDLLALGKFCICLLTGNVVFLQKTLMAGILMLMTTVVAGAEFNEIMERAKAGDVNAMCEIARCYNWGIGVSHSTERTSEWTQKAASNGCIRAVGICFERGYGTLENKTEAMKWYRKAAEAGDAEAVVRLGCCYECGPEEIRNAGEAVAWYRKAIAAGNASAMRHLGDCYKAGNGVEKDEAKALDWHRKAADFGDVVAMFKLGYESPAASVAGNDSERMSWYLKAAEAGLSVAMHHLVLAYEMGAPEDGIEKDFVEAAKWCRKLVDLEPGWWLTRLGFFYHKGIGGKKDDVEAVKLFRKAAELGDEEAMRNLGWMYRHGKGVEKDEVESAKWYRKAPVRDHSMPYRAHRLHDLNIGWQYEAAVWCHGAMRRVCPWAYSFRNCETTTWYGHFLMSVLCDQFDAFARGAYISPRTVRVGAVLGAVLVSLLFLVDWIVRLIRWLTQNRAQSGLDESKRWEVSLRRGGMRWWRLYAGAPMSVKVASMICATLTTYVVLDYLSTLVVSFSSIKALGWFVLCALCWFMLHRIVRGGTRLPVYILVFAPCALIFSELVLKAGFFEFSFVTIALIAISAGVLLVPFLLPSTRRWARAYRDKKSALALERLATYEEQKSVKSV